MGKHVNNQCNPWWVEGEEQREEDQSEIEYTRKYVWRDDLVYFISRKANTYIKYILNHGTNECHYSAV